MTTMLHHKSQTGRALLAALALTFTTSVGFASDAHYYVNDPLATTVAIADAAGEIAAIEADAFGSPLAAGEAPSRYTGKPYDADLGAFVFPFRNYRPEEGRWMSADPSGFPDGVNASCYAPSVTRGVDPLGLVTVVRVENPGDFYYGGPSESGNRYSGRPASTAYRDRVQQVHNSWELFGSGGLSGNKGQSFSVAISGSVSANGEVSVEFGNDTISSSIGGSAGVSLTAGGEFTMPAPEAHQWWQAELVYGTFNVMKSTQSASVRNGQVGTWSSWSAAAAVKSNVRSMNVGVRWTLLE